MVLFGHIKPSIFLGSLRHGPHQLIIKTSTQFVFPFKSVDSMFNLITIRSDIEFIHVLHMFLQFLPAGGLLSINNPIRDDERYPYFCVSGRNDSRCGNESFFVGSSKSTRNLGEVFFGELISGPMQQWNEWASQVRLKTEHAGINNSTPLTSHNRTPRDRAIIPKSKPNKVLIISNTFTGNSTRETHELRIFFLNIIDKSPCPGSTTILYLVCLVTNN
jgi:hypothetical protein